MLSTDRHQANLTGQFQSGKMRATKTWTSWQKISTTTNAFGRSRASISFIWSSGITLCVDSNYITYRVGGMCCAPLWKVLISKYTWSRFSNINGDMALKKRVLLQNNRGFNFWKALCPHQNVSPFKPMNYNNLSRRVLNHRGPNYFDKQGSSDRFSCISFK